MTSSSIAAGNFVKVLCFYSLSCAAEPGRLLRELARLHTPGGLLEKALRLTAMPMAFHSGR